MIVQGSSLSTSQTVLYDLVRCTIGILISHLLYPRDLIINDNRAAVCLFTRGKLPPDPRDDFNLNCLICHIYNDPVVIWVPSLHILADKYSKFKLIT